MIPANYSIFGQQIIKPNTFIGGIAKLGGSGVNAPINTASLLASKLSINVNRINAFNIVGDNVECHINGTYNLPPNSFGQGVVANSNQNLIYWDDRDNLMIGFGLGGLRGCQSVVYVKLNGIVERTTENGPTNGGLLDNAINCSNAEMGALTHMRGYYWFRNTKIVNLNLPSLVYMGNFSGTIGNNFSGMTFLELLSAKKLKQIGTDPNLNANNFAGIKTGAKIQVHIDLRTVNAGNAHAELVWVKANRSAIVEFYDDNGNYVSTL